MDENSRDLNSYSAILRQIGCEVVACCSYSDAIFQLESGNLDFVVVGQGGPLFRGRCVLERLSQLGQPVPAVVLADCADMPVYLEAMDLGASDYLEKTPDGSELVHFIEGWLRRNERAPDGRLILSAAHPESACESLKGGAP